MKMLTAFLLLCAGMALTNAAAVPEAEAEQMMEEASVQEADPEAELHEEMTGEAHIQGDDAVVLSGGCPGGWARYHDRCFLYIGATKSWALAERHCQTLGGNLASFHNDAEKSFVNELLHTVTGGELQWTWIGGSDAQQENIWLWSDGSRYTYTNWCSGQPDNLGGQQHCIEMFPGGSTQIALVTTCSQDNVQIKRKKESSEEGTK
ncbi:ladderlectin-like [Halichoeres trimaculatus]|uniref:ladderlectin-like n=1 Tax=Halichoeres trimaculatus TaxID=147232 RepID=UPI003D9E893F